MRRQNPITRLIALARKPAQDDRAAGFELAVSARRFSRRAQEVVDDKLSFSATLMRAGEVEAANRLLAEVSREVLDEEAALIERVNEVKVARSIQRDHLTRARLARTLAVALLGSSLLAFSVAGAAVVGLFRDDKASHGADPNANDDLAQADGDMVLGTREVRVLGNVSFPMTAAQYRRFSKLTAGDIDSFDERQLELFLLELLPPALAEKVHYALVTGLGALPEPVADDVVAVARSVEETRKEASQSAEEPAQEAPADDKPADPQPTPKPSDTEPSGEETPSPEETPEDGNQLPLLQGEGEGDSEG